MRWGGGPECFGGVLANPDVPIFKAACVVTGLGMCKGIFHLRYAAVLNQTHAFLPRKSTSVNVHVDLSVFYWHGYDSDNVQCNVVFVSHEDSCINAHKSSYCQSLVE